MAPKLDDLLADCRLARLFSTDTRHCALQLWVLKIKYNQLTENRVVYGRLLPYNHSSDSWFFSDKDNFHTIGQVKAKVARLNLYLKSERCAELLQLLSSGWSISALSEELKLELPEKIKAQFGETSLGGGDLIYRPVAYLLNRDAYDRRSISSPYGAAGAFSASITQTNKMALFRLGEGYDTTLTAMVVKQLDADTGLDFGGADTTRIGDIELLVFPTLDDREQDLLTVSWVDSPRALVARFNPIQVPHFSGFKFRLSIANGGQIIYASLATAERAEEGEFECTFEVSDHLREMTDSTELEIFGFHGDFTSGGLLCCRWRVGYFREFKIEGHLVNHGGGAFKFDWLEKTVRPSVSTRLKDALTLNHGDVGFNNRISGRKADPWVSVNRDLVSLFARLHPPKSEAQFFLRWVKDEPESRLEFVEWFKALLAKYQQHQIVIFDPYFEDAGLGLLLLCAAQNADYIVFRSLPKKQFMKNETASTESEEFPPGGIDNLVKSCEHNRNLLRRFKLRIYGMKDGRLHDRYILIVGADGLPVAGFNLSNSFQKAAENYPLLVTPIPADTLLKVEKYKSGLLHETETTHSKDDIDNPSIQLLFDSAASSTVRHNYEPLRFLEDQHAGDVLGMWIGDLSLQGLSGDSLKERMAALGLLKDGTLPLFDTTGLHNCLPQKASDFTNFAAAWEVIGEVLAHSNIEDYRFRVLEPERGFLEFLVRFLEASFNRISDEVGREVTVIDAQFFRKPVETLLRSSYHPHHLCHVTKYRVLTWSEYYTIKLLWWNAPDALLSIAEAQMANVPMEPLKLNTMRLSLLSQIVSEISLSVQLGISAEQQDRLVRSDSGLLQWMGLNAIEMQLEKPGGLAAMLESVAAFAYPERVRALGWMVNHAASNPQKSDIYKGLIAALHDALQVAIPADELVRLVNSMRGHMWQLACAEPWLFKDVVFPLLQSGRVNYDDVCGIWVQELASMLEEPKVMEQSLLFQREREGRTTIIAAFLFAWSSPTQQQASLDSMRKILKWPQRVVQQPLPSTSNWTRWDRALKVSMWLLTFFRWCEFYLRQRSMTNHELERLSSSARRLAMVRPMSEWRSDSAGKPHELAAFLNQVDELLETCDEQESNPI